MNFDIAVFRRSFPEFSDTVKYPDDMIAVWAALAQQQVSQSIWKNAWVLGVSLYTAHEIVVAAQNLKSVQVGGNPGLTGGIASTKTVGGATVNYDPQSTTETNAGYWNQTTYGKQFIRLVRIFGAGCIQL